MHAGQQVHGLLVAEVDVVAEQEDEDQLADILLLLIAIHSVPWEGGRGREGEGGREGGREGEGGRGRERGGREGGREGGRGREREGGREGGRG